VTTSGRLFRYRFVSITQTPHGVIATWSILARVPGIRRSCSAITPTSVRRSSQSATRSSPTAPCAHTWVLRLGRSSTASSVATLPRNPVPKTARTFAFCSASACCLRLYVPYVMPTAMLTIKSPSKQVPAIRCVVREPQPPQAASP